MHKKILPVRDIWNIVDEELGLFEDMSVIESWLNLSFEGSCSYVEVSYYDLSSLVNPYDEKHHKKKFNISEESTVRIIEKIQDLIGLNTNCSLHIQSLKVNLSTHTVPVFEVQMVPLMAI